MGKKSKRRGTNGTNTANRRAVNGSLVLKDALRSCSTERFKEVCKDLAEIVSLVIGEDYDPDTEDRETVEEKLVENIPVQRLSPPYRTTTMRQLKAVGGMRITAVPQKGSVKSYMYSTGFADLKGGKELLMQWTHRTAMPKSVFNHLFKRHKEGHPVLDGHSANCGNILYMIKAPDENEATLLKASKTLEPTRLYGLTGYSILLVQPIAVRVNSQVDFLCLTEDDKSKLMSGEEVDGFLPIKSSKLRKCECCHVTENELDCGKFLLKCSKCKSSLYCSKECQKLAWAGHKSTCNWETASEEERSKGMAEWFGLDEEQTKLQENILDMLLKK